MARTDLEAAARDCINEAIYDMEVLDLQALRDNAEEQASGAADSVCIYTSHCLDIIAEYECEADSAEDLTSGRTYEAADWQQAMSAYACAVAYTIISRNIHNLLEEIEEAADDLRDAAGAHGLEDPADPRISSDCPHGWAVHDREDEAGTCFWTEGKLEGCRAVAVKVAGLWLSYTWTPEPPPRPKTLTEQTPAS